MTKKALPFVLANAVLLLLLPFASASEDHVNVRYLPGYVMTGYPVNVVIGDSYKGGSSLIRNVYRKLDVLAKRGRLEFAWPDAPSITIEVKYQGKILKSTISPNQTADSQEFRDFQKTWNEAYALIWKAIGPRLEPSAGP